MSKETSAAEKRLDMEGSTLFATTASTETLNGTILGVIVVLPSLSQKSHPKSYRLAKQKLTT